MKKFAVLLLVLSLMCGVLTGCANGRGNIDDTDGVVTDTPRDDDNGVIDDVIDDDNGNKNGNNGDDANKDNKGGMNNNNGSDNDNAVPTAIPGQSSAVATQPVTP